MTRRRVLLGVPLLFASAVLMPVVLLNPHRPARVEAWVFVDLNDSGISDEGDVGFPGLTVLLDGEIEAVTDESGSAVFSRVRPGSRSVALSSRSLDTVRNHGLDPGEGMAKVVVRPGEQARVLFALGRTGFLEVGIAGSRRDAPVGCGGVVPIAAPAAGSEVPRGHIEHGSDCGCGR